MCAFTNRFKADAMRFDLGKKPQEDSSRSSLSSVYLRNFGNGKLEFADGLLRFYVEKGRFAKQKELSKEIPVVEAESLVLDKEEISVTLKDVVYRFVFGNAQSAKAMYEMANAYSIQSSKASEEICPITEEPTTIKTEHSSLSKPLEIPVKETAQETRKLSFNEAEEIAGPTQAAHQRTQTEVAKRISLTLRAMDSAVDILRVMYGRVDWGSVDNHLKTLKTGLAALNYPDMPFANDGALQLSAASKDHDLEATLKEATRVLVAAGSCFDGVVSAYGSGGCVHPNYADAKAITESYLVLCDIILASVVGDADASAETKHLEFLLTNLAKQAGFQMNFAEVTKALNRLQVENGRQLAIEDCRRAFREQVKQLLIFP